MIILGIDPGTTRVGYGVIKKDKGLHFVAAGTIGTDVKNPYLRLKTIEGGLRKIIKKYKPGLSAVEKLYFSKNQKTALSVAEAKGVIMLTLGKEKIPIKEFGPSEIKSVVTGSGRSDKKAVERVVALILKVPKIEGFDDASDALAIAIRASLD